MSLWITVPTYEEIDAIEPFLARALPVARALDAQLLFVDDDSPDGTGRRLAAIAEGEPRVHVAHRAGKEGLGAAYRAGFEHALAAGATAVAQMDVDLSHPPEVLERMSDGLRWSDLVIGSRYVNGGSTPGWSRRRWLLSRWASRYCKAVLRLRVDDLMGGFKLWRAETLRDALDHSTANGYVFQVEMTAWAMQLGAQAGEVPIAFHDRVHGDSKMSRHVIVEAALHVWRVRRQLRVHARRAIDAPGSPPRP